LEAHFYRGQSRGLAHDTVWRCKRVMNPSAKAAGLYFQLSSPPKRDGPKSEQRSDIRPHDNGPETIGTRVCSYSDCEYFTQRQFVRRNLASIRFSRYIGAVCSLAKLESAFSNADHTRGRRLSNGLSTVRHRFLLSAKAGGFLGAKAVTLSIAPPQRAPPSTSFA
jgi:hypothetical protein